MDTVAAIQAAKQQLEADKSKKKTHQQQQQQVAQSRSRSFQSNNRSRSFHNDNSNLYPPATTAMRAGGFSPAMPPTNVVSFGAAVDWNEFGSNEDNDEDSITSSLSGTLPGDTSNNKSPMVGKRAVLPALTRDHLLGVEPTAATPTWGGPQQQRHNHSDCNSKVATAVEDARRQSSSSSPPSSLLLLGDVNTAMPTIPTRNDDDGGKDESNTNANNNANSLTLTTMIQAMTDNGASSTDSSAKANKNAGATTTTATTNDCSKSSKTASGSNRGEPTNDAARRIEEIMTAYQGKVDTILNKRRKWTTEGGDGGEGAVVSTKSISALVAGAAATITASTVSATAPTTPRDTVPPGSTSTTSSASVLNTKKSLSNDNGGGGDSKIDDILSTYKKRVGEIMSKKLTTATTPTMVSDTAMTVDEGNNFPDTAYDDDDGFSHSDDEIHDDDDRGGGIDSHDSREEDSREGGDSREHISSSSSKEEEDASQGSHISGASSASDALSRIHGVADGDTQQPSLSTTLARRKCTLLTNNVITPLPEMTKGGKLFLDIEDEQRHLWELERRLTEAKEREEEISTENRRLKENCNDVKSQLDIVQAEARSSKYSSSEQASRIKELERKLKNESERIEELERERDAMKEEFEQDLDEQKDINRQLEQMLMSEEFEKELEDEINQVKELEHINRRFKVKIEMLEREKSTNTKKHDMKIEELEKKITSLKEQLVESDTRARHLDEEARNSDEKWEATLADEKRHSRDVQDEYEKVQAKVKVMEAEIEELRDFSTKIDEYEQILGKLMERNEELEDVVIGAKEEVKGTRDELEMSNRQAELLDRRRAVKVKDLEVKIEEQRVVIEQQQETLDESVKTILKLYSLSNTRGDDFSVMSEEKLTDMARAMVPRLGTNRSVLAPIMDEDHGGSLARSSSGHTVSGTSTSAKRHAKAAVGGNSSRGRELMEEVQNLYRQSQPRAKSIGRTKNYLEYKNRMESRHRQSRAISNGRPCNHLERSPSPNRKSRQRTAEYDPTGPAPQTRALVSVLSKECDNFDILVPPPSRSNYKRESAGVRDRGALYDPPYNESSLYNSRQPGPLPQSSVSRANRIHHNHTDRRARDDGDRGRDWGGRDKERNRANDPHNRCVGQQDRSGGYHPRSGGLSTSSRYSGGDYRSNGNGASHAEDVNTSSRRSARVPTSKEEGGGGRSGYNERYPGRGRDTGRLIRDP